MAGFHTKTFSKFDDYMTPKYAWENISEFIPKNKVIWEPFFGDGKSGQYLKELGFDVIHESIDFFENNKGDIIVTNPPFTKIKEILDRLFILDKPFIILSPCSKIHTSYFRKYKEKDLQLIIPRKRIHFIKKINGEIPKNYKSVCNFDCFYYCYKIKLKRCLTWLE